MSSLVPCIIAGGAGTRLWPVSREGMPKPFMRLPDGESLLQKTFMRAASLPSVERIVTVTQREQYFRTQDDYRQYNHRKLAVDFLLEPEGRDTAAAIAVAALHVADTYGPEAQMLVLPADHLIQDQAAFAEAVAAAQAVAADGVLVTFGLVPARAETGFGYIERGSALTHGAFEVARFVEKPDQATAEDFLAGGNHLWNAGMFCMRADAILQELALHAPAILDAAQACLATSPRKQGHGETQVELAAEPFSQAPALSIDYAVMEHSRKVAVLPCQLGWSDIGSWQAIRELAPADAQGNQYNGETVLHDTHNCYIDSPRRVVGCVGVKDLIIVDTPDALLIADTHRSQDVRVIAKALKDKGHEAYRLHRTVTRPWGTYTVLEEGKRFKIKRIVVKPEAQLSLQMHHHRSEHWIIVSGMAKVTNGDEEFLLDTNESTFIKPGRMHRLMNPGVIDLVMIEVQSGGYLGEDDIVRFTDVYGRVS